MPFNLNKLVQPECGGPNPLVATSQQIAQQIAATSSRVRNHRQPTLNFTKEFIEQSWHQQQQNQQLQQNHHPNQYHHHHQQHQQQQQHFQFQQQPTRNNILNLNPGIQKSYDNNTAFYVPMTHTHQTQDAGEQLENKYREDLLSQKPSVVKDDIEFWQGLAQQYIGPVTVGTNNRTEMDYIFEERNPLEDQFENPFEEGLKKLAQGDIPSAALLFEAAVQKEPDNAVAWRYLGTTQAQNEKDKSAIRALRNCLKINSNDQDARLAISVSLANETYRSEACKYLLEWLINHDRYKSIHASFDEYKELDNELVEDPFFMNSIDKKHYDYVRDKFVEAARMSPNDPDPEVQSSLGVLFNMRGEYEKAVDCFKAALSVRSDDSLLWNRLGATLANGNKSDEAVIAYRKALELSPGFLRSRYNLAISLVHLNTYDEAAKQLVQILNMQAAGKGSKNTQIDSRAITSTAIWNTLRTVATLLNKPELYPIIDGRNLKRCNEEILHKPVFDMSEASTSMTD